MQFAVKDVITHALREINVLDFNDVATGRDAMFALSRLVLMADSWEADRLTIQCTQRKVYDLVQNKASYTLGPGGDWDGYAPEFLATAGFINTFVNPVDPLETPVDVYTDERWRSIALKTLTSTIVWGIWMEKTYDQTSGRRTVFVHPIITNIGQIALYYPIPLVNVTIDAAGLNATLTLPPGYFKALIYNLAFDICDGFEKTPPVSLEKKAYESLQIIKRANVEPMLSRLPRQLIRRVKRGYNILVNQ